jgi:hypothetical protein
VQYSHILLDRFCHAYGKPEEQGFGRFVTQHRQDIGISGFGASARSTAGEQEAPAPAYSQVRNREV